MKKLLSVLFLFTFCTVLQAEEINYYGVTANGGNLEAMCRKLWSEYDSQYSSKSIMLPSRNGLDGQFNLKTALESPHPRKFFCGGISMWAAHPILYPNSDVNLNDVKPLVQFVQTPVLWYVPNTNKSQSFNELVVYWKSLNRPINVANWFSLNRIMINYLKQEHGLDINIIEYKNSAQVLPSLADGSIDLAWDSGSLFLSVAESGKFRMAGYNHYRDLPTHPKYPNFGNELPELKNYFSGLVIATINMSSADQKIVANRIVKIATSSEFQTFLAGSTGSSGTGFIDNELQKKLHIQKQQAQKYLK